jgi:hypothetical protein
MVRGSEPYLLNHGAANQNAPNRPQRRQRRVTDGHDPAGGTLKTAVATLFGHRPEGSLFLDAGVVDKDVNASEMAECR